MGRVEEAMSLRTYYVWAVNCDCASYTHAWLRPVQPGKFRRCIYCGRQLGDMQLNRYQEIQAGSYDEAIKVYNATSTKCRRLGCDEHDVVARMKAFAAELCDLFNSGCSLREIAKYSFQAREAGHNVPYLQIMDTEQDGTVNRIVAAPVAKQREIKAFFDEIAPGCKARPRYMLFVDLSGVHFTERLSQKEVVELEFSFTDLVKGIKHEGERSVS